MGTERQITIPVFEYNIICNESSAYERALTLLLDERGVDELYIGNVYLYRAEGGGVGAWFIDENCEKLKPVNYAFTEHGRGY